jgi:hypothetical protein
MGLIAGYLTGIFIGNTYMKIRSMFIVIGLLLLFGSGSAWAQTLNLSSVSGAIGETVTLTVTLGSNSTGVAGTAFTLTYDSEPLSLVAVRSNFFPTFAAQNITPNQVTIDGIPYDKALVVNGAMIAAARVDNGTGDAELFQLDFTIAASATAGQYPIAIIASTIYNEAAGYTNPAGTAIPMLIGIDGTSYPERTISNSPSATITVNAGFVDEDEDGIDDQWERDHVPGGTPPGNALNIFTATGDYDKDGYSDYQEYHNWHDGVDDPNGTEFDPIVVNAPGGVGWVAPSTLGVLPALYLLFDL